MLQDIIVSAVLPYLSFLLLQALGISTVPALAMGAIFPVASIAIAFARSGRIQAIGILTLSATVASVITSLYFQSPTLALAKGSMITGSIGMAFGLSLFAPRPLVFYLSVKDAESLERSETRWQTMPAFRKAMRFITSVWCIVLLCEAGLRLLLIPLLSVELFLPISEAMWICCFALLMARSFRYGRRKVAEASAANASR